MLKTKDRTSQKIILLFCFWPPPCVFSDLAALCDLQCSRFQTCCKQSVLFTASQHLCLLHTHTHALVCAAPGGNIIQLTPSILVMSDYRFTLLYFSVPSSCRTEVCDAGTSYVGRPYGEQREGNGVTTPAAHGQ